MEQGLAGWVDDAAVLVWGLVLGSFLNVVAYRVPRGLSVVWPPSACPHCGGRLASRDLIPLFSFLWLRGRCRRCRAPISPLYPLGEALTALAFWLVWRRVGLSPELAVGLGLASLLVTATVADLRDRLIPNRVVATAAAFLGGCRLIVHPLPLEAYVWGAVAGFGTLYALNGLSLLVFRQEGIGGGDMKLMAAVGLAAGWQAVLLALAVGSLLGGAVAVLLLVTGKVRRRQYLPFGPMLAAGSLIAYLWGDRLIGWYLGWYM